MCRYRHKGGSERNDHPGDAPGRVCPGGIVFWICNAGSCACRDDCDRIVCCDSMTSGGGAWDNAKKYIEEGHHGGKGSPADQAAVTGDVISAESPLVVGQSIDAD